MGSNGIPKHLISHIQSMLEVRGFSNVEFTSVNLLQPSPHTTRCVCTEWAKSLLLPPPRLLSGGLGNSFAILATLKIFD